MEVRKIYFDLDGVLADFDKWKLLAEVEPWWASQKIGQIMQYKIEANYLLGTNLSVGGHFLYEDKQGNDMEEVSLGLRIYF